MHKHKLTLQQQQQQQQQQVAAAVAAAAAQSQQAAGAQPATQVQSAQTAQGNPQLAAVAAPRPGAVLTGTTVANLQVARLVNTISSTLNMKLLFLFDAISSSPEKLAVSS